MSEQKSATLPPPKPKQKRYYSLSEIYRKYVVHLKKEMILSPADFSRTLQTLRQLLRWLKEHSLTIYAFTRRDVKEFIVYLLQYCHPRTGYYQRDTLYRKLKEISFFLDWLRNQGIIEEELLPREVYIEFRSQIRSRDRPSGKTTYNYEVPEVFSDIYRDAFRMESGQSYSSQTLRERQKGWGIFFQWIYRQGIKDIKQVRVNDILAYQEYLKEYINPLSGRRFTPIIRFRRNVELKRLFEALIKTGGITVNPMSVVSIPKCPRGLPHTLISRHEMDKLFSLPDITTTVGIRDRTIMEVFYSTGMRLNELLNLKLEDILYQEGMVRVMVPKGGVAYQRVVPIGEIALEWVKKYINKARPILLGKERHPYLFVNQKSGPLKKTTFTDVLTMYCSKAGFRKKITSHSFRVTCATDMLRHRADIRYVQAQLGHTSLQSTQIYARVLPTDLKKVHQRTHPRARHRESTA